MNVEREITSGQRVQAYFQPRIATDLKPGAENYVGRAGIFEALWRIGADEPYGGEWAMRIPGGWQIETAVWVPSGDLKLALS